MYFMLPMVLRDFILLFFILLFLDLFLSKWLWLELLKQNLFSLRGPAMMNRFLALLLVLSLNFPFPFLAAILALTLSIFILKGALENGLSKFIGVLGLFKIMNVRKEGVIRESFRYEVLEGFCKVALNGALTNERARNKLVHSIVFIIFINYH
ncbi:unnamed protein product [Moneuplotes crassus]|uniref:Uncharacterized protein n=1 Tax=Euplotes crassus TaxID=5936 RepID=A0AAD1Y222_EUPCR|nr:unnamed protein product [Moneuplotes crassus]